MNLHQLNDSVVETWNEVTRAILDAEIEKCYEKHNLEASVVERLDGPLKTKLKNNTTVQVIVFKRLNEMYQDPQFGPHFFLKNTKLLRSCLLKYRRSKSNPAVFGRFFHCSSPSPGIIIHFNSVTGKKEIFFLLNLGDTSRQKPVKLDIVTILRWHRNRKAKALKARQDEVEAQARLVGLLSKTVAEYFSAFESFRLVHKRYIDLFNDYLDDLLLRVTRSEIQTRYISDQIPRLLELKQFGGQLTKDLEEASRRQADFDSLNPRLFELKEFLQMQISHYMSEANSYLSRRDHLVNYVNSLEEY